MKLLFDANLSPVLVGRLADLFPFSKHIFDEGELISNDTAIWDFAKKHNFVIVTKDSDFHHMSFIFHAPPKVIWLRIGNATTEQIEKLVRENSVDILAFYEKPEKGFLIVK